MAKGYPGTEPIGPPSGQVDDDLLVHLLEGLHGLEPLEHSEQRAAGRGLALPDRLPVDQQDAAGAFELHGRCQAADARSDEDRVPVTVHATRLPSEPVSGRGLAWLASLIVRLPRTAVTAPATEAAAVIAAVTSSVHPHHEEGNARKKPR